MNISKSACRVAWAIAKAAPSSPDARLDTLTLALALDQLAFERDGLCILVDRDDKAPSAPRAVLR